MADLYLDTSALVKLYVQEAGTETMLKLTEEASGHRLFLSSLAAVEARSAIRLLERTGAISHPVAETICEALRDHLAWRYIRQPVSEPTLELAAALLDRHPLRAYDAVQLASCLTLAASGGDAPRFLCSDERLLRAAETEGLGTLNPAASA